jgi:hypothetical protein
MRFQRRNNKQIAFSDGKRFIEKVMVAYASDDIRNLNVIVHMKRLLEFESFVSYKLELEIVRQLIFKMQQMGVHDDPPVKRP